MRGLGQGGRLDDHRRRLAEEYRALPPCERRARLAAFREDRRQLRMAQEAADDAGEQGELAEDSHWGMGTNHWPLAPSALDAHIRDHARVGFRGGLRQLTETMFPESSLIVRPDRRRLAVPREFRDNCKRKSRGFCRTDDEDIAESVLGLLYNLKQHVEAPKAAGLVAMRFYAGDDPGNRDKTQDVHVSFGFLRQPPKYTAVYVMGTATDRDREADFPFFVTDVIARAGAVPRPARPAEPAIPGFEGDSLLWYRSWALAVFLCRRFAGLSICMELLSYKVTEHLKTIFVTGVELVVENVTVGPVTTEAAAAPRRGKLRGIFAIAKSVKDAHRSASSCAIASTAEPDKKRAGSWRRHLEVFANPGSAQSDPAKLPSSSEGDPWWWQALKRPRQKRAGVSGDEIECDGPEDDDTDSGHQEARAGLPHMHP